MGPEWENKVPTELFRDWAKEVAEKVCSEVYAPMTVNHADGTRIDSPFALTDELFGKWVTLAEDLIAIGGERLAFVLNEIIEHKRHRDAHREGRALPSRKVAVGTEHAVDGVETIPSSGGNTNGSRAAGAKAMNKDFSEIYRRLKLVEITRSRRNAWHNAYIAILLVPLLLVILKWHERIGGVSLLAIAKKLKV